VLLARHAIPDVMRLLKSLLRAADDGVRTGSVIEILVLQAIGYQIQDNIAAALLPLERALTLAEPEGYVRMFVDEGPAVAALLQVAAKRRAAPGYARQLLPAFDKPQNRTPLTQLLVEPLSEREVDVLRLLGTNLDGPEIARQLVVSLSTLRTHTRSIYSKLGVNNRRAAVRRAEELLRK
jgi:LuxR family transcriptional regulator, maltose regulon positive regulatory protein